MSAAVMPSLTILIEVHPHTTTRTPMIDPSAFHPWRAHAMMIARAQPIRVTRAILNFILDLLERWYQVLLRLRRVRQRFYMLLRFRDEHQ